MKKRKTATTSPISITQTVALPSAPTAPLSTTAPLPASTPVALQVTPTVSLDDQVIAHRAYAIWQAEGEPVGRDYEHWLKAESELRASAMAGLATESGAVKSRE